MSRKESGQVILVDMECVEQEHNGEDNGFTATNNRNVEHVNEGLWKKKEEVEKEDTDKDQDKRENVKEVDNTEEEEEADGESDNVLERGKGQGIEELNAEVSEEGEDEGEEESDNNWEEEEADELDGENSEEAKELDEENSEEAEELDEEDSTDAEELDEENSTDAEELDEENSEEAEELDDEDEHQIDEDGIIDVEHDHSYSTNTRAPDSDESVILISDSDDETPLSKPAQPSPVFTPTANLASPFRKSQFSPDYSTFAPIQKNRFRVQPQVRGKKIAWSPRPIYPRPSSSLHQRSKAPLGMEEFKAGVRVRQQARIQSMIRDAYKTMSQNDPYTFQDFYELVKKRTHVQRLLDFETLKPVTLQKDEHIYTRETLEALRKREANAHARLPPSDEERRTKMRSLRAQRRKEHGILGRKSLPNALPPDAEAHVQACLRQSSFMASITGAQVGAHDLAKLRPGQWLNDEVINFYGALIMLRASHAESKREDAFTTLEANGYWSVHFFSSFFWENLSKRGYSGVRRWSRRVDLFTKDLILFPINLGQAHWVCAAINLRLRRFEYYDSMGIPRPVVFEKLRAYLVEELHDKKQATLDLCDWQDFFAADTSPQQSNGYDCGVFAIQTLEQLSRRDPHIPMPPRLDAAAFEHAANPAELEHLREEHAEEYAWNFSQQNMQYLRRRMAYEIGQQKLLA
ncbi:Ulp1 peptidase [Malassezia vespertilionis]|uniref:Ulp1p n=1 Tax=Malassezia vespertilionis TaxID=2020962 RepID=A0A2N1J7Q9_9BASI|nr:Ulp1 peptidase [Malassezia vespertilionis]PKI82591.1 Ulp1p [Malassezia vespertilionis]WFD08552.1 Ulp1 peptidase [Malassezia vespertilionis]